MWAQFEFHDCSRAKFASYQIIVSPASPFHKLDEKFDVWVDGVWNRNVQWKIISKFSREWSKKNWRFYKFWIFYLLVLNVIVNAQHRVVSCEWIYREGGMQYTTSFRKYNNKKNYMKKKNNLIGLQAVARPDPIHKSNNNPTFLPSSFFLLPSFFFKNTPV